MRWSCPGTHHAGVFVSHRNARPTVHGGRRPIQRVRSGPAPGPPDRQGDTPLRRKSKLFTQALPAADIAHKHIHPYRPQTNGKVERFNACARLAGDRDRMFKASPRKQRACSGAASGGTAGCHTTRVTSSGEGRAAGGG